MQEKIRRLLLWSQKYTRTDMLYLARGGFWVLLGQACNGILSLVLVVAFANLLPKETFGTYRYILSIAAVLNIFTLSGMNAAVSRITAKGNEGLLQPAVTYQLKWNLLMFVAFCILGIYYTHEENTVLGISFFILGLFVPASLALNTYGAYLEGKKEFKRANILSIVSTLSYSLGMFIALFFTDDVRWLIATYAAATFVPSFIFYVYVIKKFAPPPSTDIQDTLAFGRELSYLRLIDPVVSQIDKIILAHFWGPAQLATYTLALAVPSRATLFMKSWLAIGYPKFSEKTPDVLNQVFWRRIAQGAGIGLCISLCYIVAAPFLFTYALPQYLDGIVYSQILSLGFIFALPNRYASLLFASQRMSRVLYTRTIIENVTTITLLVVAGIWGGLLWLVIAHVVMSAFAFVLNVSLWRIVTRRTA